MNCCVECFTDSQIRDVINAVDKHGVCDFCGNKGINIYSLDEDSGVSDYIDNILDIYNVSWNPNDKLLKDALHDDWNVFAGSSDDILFLLTELQNVCTSVPPALFSENVSIPTFQDYIETDSITHGKAWSEFADIIKYKNRFHSNIFNYDAFASFLSFALKIYPKGQKMYRARISHDINGFACDKMGTPPKSYRTAGRINPEGIGVLYLASDEKTALFEVRANVNDYLTVGEFELKKEMRIIDLANVGAVSPFIYSETNDLQRYAVNYKLLKEIADEIAKPQRRNDSTLDYLPTQYISEYIKSQNYDGVEYLSTMRADGYNFAIFDESQLECVETRVYEIESLTYEPKLIEKRDM
jgi:hypothetical protein